MNRKSASVLLLGIFISAACGDGDSPTSPDPATPSPGSVVSSSTIPGARSQEQLPENFPIKRILCFGDSVTLGVTAMGDSSYGGRTQLQLVEGYPVKLWRLLEEKYGVGFDVVSAGIGGENTREGLERIDNEIRIHDPDLVLILEGVVDINNEFPRYPVVRSSLAEMMRLVQLRGRLGIIGTYPLLNPDGFRTSGWGNVPRLNDVIRQEAKAKNMPVADHEKAFDADHSGLGPDGLHPNNIGYEIMAETWLEQIDLILEDLGVGTGT